jgi:hypothetical protein
MKQALIHDSRICEFNTPFPVHADLKWVEVADDTTVEDTYVDGSVVKKPEPPTPTAAELALAEIHRLEALETPRRMAEAQLTDEGKAWLTANRDLIATERAKL